MKQKSVWALTVADGFMTMIIEVCQSGAVSYFYMKNLGLKISCMTMVWTVFAFWNAIDDLIAGSISDRTKNRLGRRIPYVRFCGLLAGIFFALSFVKFPFVQSQLGLAISAFLVLGMLDFATSFLEITLFAIPVEETLDDGERGKIYLLELLADAVALAVPTYLIPLLQPAQGESTTGFSAVMCAIGLVSGLAIFFSSFYMESGYQIPDEEEQPPLLPYILGFLKSRPFLTCEFFSVSVWTALSVFMLGMYYYFDEVPNWKTACYGALVVSAAFSMFLYWKFREKFGTKDLCVIAQAGGAVFMALGYVAGIFFGKMVLAGILAFFGYGFAYIGNMFFLSFMMGDVADYDEYRNGLRREGILFGFDNIFCCVANLSQAMFLTIILAFGYVEHQPEGTQSLLAQQGILTAWLLIPAGILAVGAICTYCFYPLDKKAVVKMKKELEHV